MSTFSIFLVLIVIVAFLLIVVIMVQNPKGGGLASSFGGGGTQQLGGVQKTTDFLDKSTWTLAGVLLVLILLSNISIMDSSNTIPSIDEDDIETTAPAVETPAAISTPDTPVETNAVDDLTTDAPEE